MGDGRKQQQQQRNKSPISFLFVHINKTGGTSLFDMFRQRCADELIKSEAFDSGGRSFHATATAFIDHFGRDTWEKAYTFAIVRHPLARQVSDFFFLAKMCTKNKKKCEDRFIPERVRGDNMLSLSDDEKIQAFHDWISVLYKNYPPGST